MKKWKDGVIGSIFGVNVCTYVCMYACRMLKGGHKTESISFLIPSRASDKDR